MLTRLIRYSIRNKLIILFFTITIAGVGVYSLMHIPVGAVPDITNNQVQVITTTRNLSTQDVEQFITYPVELEMANLPGVKEIRSVSKFGLSVVTVVFEDRLGTFLPRQLIAEKIKIAAEKVPEGYDRPEMGPISTGLGEIYQYTLETEPGYEEKYSTTDLRTIQDWLVKRQLSGIPGVVEVNTWGGHLKQYEIAVSPHLILALGLSVTDILTAVESGNSVAGGGYIEKDGRSYFIRGEGLIGSLADIESIVVTERNGIPVYVHDIARVGYGHATRFGAITGNGEGEKVLGQIMMLKNGNSREVIRAVKNRVSEVQKALPEGVYINAFLERSELIKKTTTTVAENLLFGCLIVIFVVILLLGNLRSGLIVASVIPLVLLFAISLMYVFGIDANLMSLGAIDFGIIIDGAVIIVEFIAFRINAKGGEIGALAGSKRQSLMDSVTFEGASKMMNSAVFGQLIILIVFIPVLSLSGVEGKMFKPMALTFSFALVGAMILCFTYLPVAASVFLKPRNLGNRNLSDRLMQFLTRLYIPSITWSLGHKRLILAISVLLLVFSGYLYTRMGGEFVPTLDEGDFVIQPVLPTGTSLGKTIEITTQIERILKGSFPEVLQVVSRIGAAEVPTDPMSMEESDIIIRLKPIKNWVSADNKDELAEKMKEALAVIPGLELEFTQPIEMRFNELITGVRADVAVKIFGDDLQVLHEKAAEVARVIQNVAGASDIVIEKTEGLPQMSVVYNRQLVARYGLKIDDLNRLVSMAFSGYTAGSVFEGEKRFDMVIRFDKPFRMNLDDLQNLPVDLPAGGQIPLKEIADIGYTEGPAKISRDNTRRRIVVGINVRDRDMQSVVEDIDALIISQVKLPPGYYITYGGQFANLKSAANRLKIAVPIALLLILIMLHFAFQSFKDALMVFTAIPLSAVGGVVLLWTRGMPFSISAGIGFIALFGIAVLNGIVLIEYFKELEQEGLASARERVIKGTSQRLRPVMVTAAAAALGFLPMALSTSAGAEVQRPLATVVIGGLISSTLLTMIVLPVLYCLYENRGKDFLRFKTRPKAVLFAVFLFGTFSLKAQQTLSLEEAIRIAERNNNELQAYQLQAEKSLLNRSNAFDLPGTDVYYSYDANNFAENMKPLHVFGIQQSLETPVNYIIKRQVLNKESDIQFRNAEIKRMKLAGEVSLQYEKLLVTYQKLKRLGVLDSLYRQMEGAAVRNDQLGESAYLDLLTVRAKSAQVGLLKNEAENELLAARHRFSSLLQTDSVYRLPDQIPFPLVPDSVPAYLALGNQLQNQKSALALARHRYELSRLLPGLHVGYFVGINNSFSDKAYPGYEIGVSIPLVFGPYVNRARMAAIDRQIAIRQMLNHASLQEAELAVLRSEMDVYYNSLNQFNRSGNILSEELEKYARLSYEQGQIDFFRYIQSLEQAEWIQLDYLENLLKYNHAVLRFNYYILE